MSEQPKGKVHVTLEELKQIKEIVELSRKREMSMEQGFAMAILEDSVDLALERFGGGK